MPFHAFRAVYTVKELDSHAKHGQSFKNLFGCITEYFCAKHLTSGFVQVSESFFDRGSCWCKRWWSSLYGHFSRKNAPVHTSTWARARALHPTALLHGTHSGRISLKNVFLWGKDNLVQLPEEPSVMWTVDAVCFSGQQRSFSSEFVNEGFINKAQFNAGFAHHLILKDGAVPAIKDPGHDSEQQTSVKRHQMSVFCWWSCSSARHSLAPPTTCRLQELGKNRKAPSFFYKYDKTKDFL